MQVVAAQQGLADTASFSTRRGTALYLLVWLMLGTVFAALVVAATGAPWINGLLFAIPTTLVYACAAGFSSYYLCRAYPLSDKGAFAIIVAFSIAAMLSAALWTTAAILWNSVWEEMGVPLPAPLKVTIFGLGVILYGLSVFAHYLAIEFSKARQAERRELESRLAAQEAELRMLRTQIDPHFLFNSLNSISALTSQNPAAAREMTLQLADFFRHTLGLQAHRKVTVAAEGKLLMHFLAIEKVRFGSRLLIECDLAVDALACMLPPMILQPLVENAVKHGIGNLPCGGTVRVRARRAGSTLQLLVENDVDADTNPVTGLGIGIDNVRQRLHTIYGHEASIHCSCENTLFRAAIVLPAETTE